MNATGRGVLVAPDVSVAAEHAEEVPTAILVGRRWRSAHAAEAHELVVQRQVGPALGPVLGAGDELPAALRKEPVVGTGDQLCAVFEGYSVAGLERLPMREHGGGGVVPIAASANRAVDRFADFELCDRTSPAVGQENRRVAGQAVNASMTAPPERVDRPVEPVARAGHVVEGGLGADLVEVDAGRLGSVKGADDGAVSDSRQPSLVVIDPLIVPAHLRTHVRTPGPRAQPGRRPSST